MPVVNVMTITREEFRRTAPMAQSFAGQAARHGVTPDAGAWTTSRKEDLRRRRYGSSPSGGAGWRRATWTRLPSSQGTSACPIPSSWGQRPNGDWSGLSRDCLPPATHRQVPPGRGADVAAGRKRPAHQGPGGHPGYGGPAGRHHRAGRDGMRLTAFSKAFRRDEDPPEMSEPEWDAVRRYLPPAVDALIAEALARSGAVREDLRRERRGGREPG